MTYVTSQTPLSPSQFLLRLIQLPLKPSQLLLRPPQLPLKPSEQRILSLQEVLLDAGGHEQGGLEGSFG